MSEVTIDRKSAERDLKSLYERLIETYVDSSLKGQRYATQSLQDEVEILEAHNFPVHLNSNGTGPKYEYNDKLPLRKKILMSEFYRTLKQAEEKGILEKVVDIVRDPLLDQAMIYFARTRGISSTSEEEFVQDNTASNKLRGKFLPHYLRPIALFRILEKSPDSIERLSSDTTFMLQTLAKKHKKLSIKECEIEVSNIIPTLFDDDLVNRIAKITAFIQPTVSTGHVRKDMFLGNYELSLSLSFKEINDKVKKEIEELYDTVDFKREAYTLFERMLSMTNSVFYANDKQPYSSKLYNLTPLQYTTIRTTTSNFAKNQVFGVWKDKNIIIETELSRLANHRAFNLEGLGKLVIIDGRKQEQTFTKDSHFLNSTKFLPLCIWKLNEFYQTAVQKNA